MRNTASILLVFGLWLSLVLGCATGHRSPYTSSSAPKYLTAEHRNAINAALAAKRYPRPVSLEINSGGWLVATFEITRVPDGSLQGFAEDALLTIREVMLPFKVVEQYRVTLNGPSPGTGLIRRYGSARFIEGGSVSWKEGVG